MILWKYLNMWFNLERNGNPKAKDSRIRTGNERKNVHFIINTKDERIRIVTLDMQLGKRLFWGPMTHMTQDSKCEILWHMEVNMPINGRGSMMCHVTPQTHLKPRIYDKEAKYGDA